MTKITKIVIKLQVKTIEELFKVYALKFIRFFYPSKLMFLTYTPGDWCKPGVYRDGMIITKVKQVAPAALITGGIAPRFEVYGKPERIF
jgi:hypothetical protein